MVRQLIPKVQGINVIDALPDIAKKAFESIGRLNTAMHGQRLGIKRQQMLFILPQAA